MAIGDLADSVRRQFDDTEGGGFADEAGAFLDPTRQASDETEADVRRWLDRDSILEARDFVPVYGSVFRSVEGALSISDTLDRDADREPPGSTDDAPDDEPDEPSSVYPDLGEYWSKVFRGTGPGEYAKDETVDAALDNPKITLAIGSALVIAVLWFLRPYVAAFGD